MEINFKNAVRAAFGLVLACALVGAALLLAYLRLWPVID